MQRVIQLLAMCSSFSLALPLMCCGQTLTFVDRRSGTVDGIPAEIALDLVLDQSTGRFDGSYVIGVPPMPLEDDDDDCDADDLGILLEELWEMKSQQGLPLLDGLSIFTVSGDDYTAVGQGSGDDGSFISSTVNVSGTPNGVSHMGSFIVRGDEREGNSLSAVSTTTFSPAGPGRVSFFTEHVMEDGSTGFAEGSLTLHGAPDFLLPGDASVGLSLEIDPRDIDGADGTLSGVFAGRIYPVPEPSNYVLALIASVAMCVRRRVQG